MDIENLRVRVAEEELNALVKEHLPADLGLQGLRIVLTAEGIGVHGQYTTMLMPISFETLWAPEVAKGQVQASLTRVNVAGFPATKLRGVLLKVIADNIGGQPGVHFEGEVVRLDLDAFLAAHKIPLRVRPTAIRCTAGALILEAGL
jgi:hypothetical protein